MTAQFARAPHQSKLGSPPHQAPHAALLIDFDNVTMGIRSDITKELKNLLNSDIIKGKVAVQRAYADWRRYPQYVVPLAEASVDLIFAPAYGSSKKNATDIRLSIDALELVFTRPEIGTFILLSGDSDFSSLVLKLKEYAKYVIGVGIRESASDLLVQNCDEYYSYSALTGLTRAGEEEGATTADPWELVYLAVQQMIANGDVMRSDRLKQVILELDANFDEKTLGFSKFNRFVSEAANRGLIRLNKLENGQFEIALPGAREEAEEAERPEERGARGRGGRRGRAERLVESGKAGAEAVEAEPAEGKPAVEVRAERRVEPGPDGVRRAFELLRRAAGELGATREKAVRDSDVKRRMLDIEPDWDESAAGFSKFSRFLRHAHDAEVIDLRKIDNGNYEVALPADAAPPAAPERAEAAESREGARGRKRRGRGERRTGAERAKAAAPEPVPEPASEPVAPAAPASAAAAPAAAAAVKTPGAQRGTGVGARRGSKGRMAAGTPSFLEGQVVPAARSPVAPAAKPGSPLAGLSLPRARSAVVDYLTKSYRGIGRKTAELLVDGTGAERVFETLHEFPERVKELVGGKRAETLIQAWRADLAARTGAAPPAAGPTDEAVRGRRGGRRRGGRGRKRAPAGKE